MNHAVLKYVENVMKNTKLIKKLIFNDVDLLPDKTMYNSEYLNFEPDVHSMMPLKSEKAKQEYPDGIPLGGGIVGFNFEFFGLINGFPNTFWGWGGEDNEVSRRIQTLQKQREKNEEATAVIRWNDNKNHTFLNNDVQRKATGEITSEIAKRKYVPENKLDNLESNTSAQDGVRYVKKFGDKVELLKDKYPITIDNLNFSLYWVQVNMVWTASKCEDDKPSYEKSSNSPWKSSSNHKQPSDTYRRNVSKPDLSGNWRK
jgi:hypothetical protein